MRRSRNIKKVVKITVPTEISKNENSRISRGKVRSSNTRKVKGITTIHKNNQISQKRINPNKVKYEKVQPIWKGETVYIIGGGPSLKNFKWNLLNNKKTIAINKAIKFYPNADAMYWTDGRVYTWIGKEIDNFKGLKYTIRPKPYTADVKILKRGIKYGLETDPSTIAHGNNSGYAAINLAIHLGAKRIVLLGYDMGSTSEGSHFHDGYPTNPTSDKIYKNQFLPGFDILKEAIKGKDIQIYNACPTSKLNAFKKITIEEALSFR